MRSRLLSLYGPVLLVAVGFGACAGDDAVDSAAPDSPGSAQDVGDAMAPNDAGGDESEADVDLPGPDVVEADVEAPPPLVFNDSVLPVADDEVGGSEVTWVGTSGGELLAASDTALWRLEGDALSEVAVGDDLEPAGVVAMSTLPGGDVLVASDGGIFQLKGSSLTTWPPSNYLSGLVFSDMLAGGTEAAPWVIVAASNGLHLWDGSSVSALSVNGLGRKDARLAQGLGEVWVVAEGDVYALSESSWEATAALEDTSAERVTVDAQGHVWLSQPEGVIWRPLDADWLALPEGVVATKAVANVAAEGAWLVGDSDLWLARGGLIRPVASPFVPQAAVADASGQLWVGGDSGVSAWTPARAVSLQGWPESGVIGVPTELVLEVEFPELVQAVDAKVGIQTVEVSEDPWTLSLVPADYGGGYHTLSVTVTYTDTELVSSLSLSFQVAILSFEEDIEPLSEARCGSCHGKDGQLGLKLITYEHWKSYLPMIIPSVESGFMPPGTNLSADEIELLHLWGDAGFPP